MVPPRILARLRSICLGLPDAYEETAWVGTRWMIRKRNFAHVLEIDGGHPPAYARAAGTDGPAVVLTFRTSDFLQDALTSGPGFFRAVWGTRWGTKVVGHVLGKRPDWDEVAVLLTESYRLLAPARLAAQIAQIQPAPRRTPKNRP